MHTGDVAAQAVGEADDGAAGIAVTDGADVMQRAHDAHLAARPEGVQRRVWVIHILACTCRATRILWAWSLPFWQVHGLAAVMLAWV